MFDKTSEGKLILLHEKWNASYKLESPMDLFPIPWFVIFGFIWVLFSAHMVASWWLIRKYFHKVAREGWTKRILECLWTFVCPPLFLDWDQGGDSTSLKLI